MFVTITIKIRELQLGSENYNRKRELQYDRPTIWREKERDIILRDDSYGRGLGREWDNLYMWHFHRQGWQDAICAEIWLIIVFALRQSKDSLVISHNSNTGPANSEGNERYACLPIEDMPQSHKVRCLERRREISTSLSGLCHSIIVMNHWAMSRWRTYRRSPPVQARSKDILKTPTQVPNLLKTTWV